MDEDITPRGRWAKGGGHEAESGMWSLVRRIANSIGMRTGSAIASNGLALSFVDLHIRLPNVFSRIIASAMAHGTSWSAYLSR